MAKIGRDPDNLKILPGGFIDLGDSVEEAHDKRALLDSLVNYDSGIAALSIALGTTARFDPDTPLPDGMPETNPSKSGRDRVRARAKREKPHRASTRGTARRLRRPRRGRHAEDDRRSDGGMVSREGCDGFNVCSRICPADSTISSTRSCPSCSGAAFSERDYEGTTLRENLGLPARRTSSSRPPVARRRSNFCSCPVSREVPRRGGGGRRQASAHRCF